MWFTDNGRDMLGDDVPFCELNYAPVKGLHFGFPFCHHFERFQKNYKLLKTYTKINAPAKAPMFQMSIDQNI